VELLPPTDTQIEAYFSHLEASGTPLAEVRTALTVDGTLRDLLRSPLMLHVTALAYHGREPIALHQPDTGEERHNRLWQAYIDRAFEHRPLRGTGFSAEKTVAWLSWLAYELRDRGKTDFRLDRLTADWLPKRPLQPGLVPRHRLNLRRLLDPPLTLSEIFDGQPMEEIDQPDSSDIGWHLFDVEVRRLQAALGATICATVAGGLAGGLVGGALAGLASALISALGALVLSYGFMCVPDTYVYLFTGETLNEGIRVAAVQAARVIVLAAAAFGAAAGLGFGNALGTTTGVIMALVFGLWFGIWWGMNIRDSSKSWGLFSLVGSRAVGVAGVDSGRFGGFPP